MIFDALRAELLKLTRNRWSTFWAFGFIPLFNLVMGLMFESFVRPPAPPPGAFGGPSILPNVSAPFMGAVDGLAAFNNPFLQIFPIAGAAILFAGEYRWETWRSILTRNERSSILIAKMLAFALLVSAGILLSGIGGFLVSFYDIAINKAEPIWPESGAAAGLLIAFGANVLQALMTASLVMFAAIASRAMIASIIAPFILLVGIAIAASRIRVPTAGFETAALPSIASLGLDQYARGILGDPDVVGVHLAAPGAIFLALWFVVLVAAALLVFQTQDLSKE
jgi:ABC-2 type transport system permease protein